MVAYSFKKQFAPKIADGSKSQTIRDIRTGRVPHVRPGQALQLYIGMRTKYCQLVGRATCAAVTPITISFYPSHAPGIVLDTGAKFDGDGLDDFAKKDGFSGWLEMAMFWRKEHGSDLVRWAGVLIEWKDFQPGKEKARSD